MTARHFAPIDPFTPCPDGVYRDDRVIVRSTAGHRHRRRLRMVRTAHFDVLPGPGHVSVEHVLSSDEVDDDLAGLLTDELFRPGWLRGKDLFERIFTGVVLSVEADPLRSWETFYRNTLSHIESPVRPGTLADYAPVYRRAGDLIAGDSVLELGCCFGFLSLRLAASGLEATATDISPGAVELLARVAPRLGVRLATRVADATRYPAVVPPADTVLALHLVEHLDGADGDKVLVEALRLARRRVVVAVPLEMEADETWGHVRTVSLADLEAWGRRSRCRYRVFEYHGGWLVLDR
ncbi:MAG: class I SAM-dependent methyltransferase [Kineosporiaceae bacterium]|nr:class I SAM-dependent methyltransferase [Kineosporiaceae bacterium]MBK7622636.1 class I SAM-dependent methyltransferase [Kineosporiaceae bacterium]MBK8078617.1 class I SAM-dependent methyltransferase [Kineosporiaceae bacterium]